MGLEKNSTKEVIHVIGSVIYSLRLLT